MHTLPPHFQAERTFFHSPLVFSMNQSASWLTLSGRPWVYHNIRYMRRCRNKLPLNEAIISDGWRITNVTAHELLLSPMGGLHDWEG